MPDAKRKDQPASPSRCHRRRRRPTSAEGFTATTTGGIWPRITPRSEGEAPLMGTALWLIWQVAHLRAHRARRRAERSSA